MFDSEEWKTSKFASTQDEKKCKLLDNQFWKNIVTCLKDVCPTIGVLRLVDSNAKPAMGFVYSAIDSGKKKR